MATTKIRGNSQIMEQTLDKGRLVLDFLAGANWNITNGSNNATITGLQDPVNAQDAATKHYVDLFAQGLKVKDSVRLTTATSTGNITLSGLQAIDGETTVSGDRVLVTHQTTASQNGIYISSTGTWVRATDYAAGTHAAGTFMFVEEGNTLADTGWVCTTDAPNDVVGTDALAYTQFSGAGQYTASNGVKLVGNDFQANLATGGGIKIISNQLTIEPNDFVGNGLEDDGSDNLRVKADAVGGANLAKVINVTANGVAVKIDDSTIKENVSNQLYVDATGLVTGNSGLTTSSGVIIVELEASGGIQFGSGGGIELVDRPIDMVWGEVPTLDTGAETATLTATPKAGTERVFLNGIRMIRGASYDYTIATNVITFTAPGLQPNDIVTVDYIK